MSNSWNGPQLGSPIRTDVPELQKKLIALLKGDPTSVADIPSGAKRLVNTSGVQWQVQQYNGSSWAAIGKLMHDVDKLDGYHAAITPAASTIAVRNADKKLEGDITGNAATASSAATLSETLPVNKGGTSATTSEAARSNLGVPPTSHTSTTTTYGVGNATQYGHLKLSDATDSASGATGGTAATPAAVKAAKDAADAAQSSANNAQSSADAAMTKASTLATSSVAGIVKPGTGMTVDAAGALNVSLNNTVTSTSTTQAATANAVKTAYDKAEEAASKAGLPLGHIFAWPFPTAPDGCIILNGSTYNRNLYTDLFAYVKSKGWTKTETEWQSIARSNNGFCPWYSEGDGSTNFRTPKFAPYQKLTIASGDAGKYYQAGLPNIVGRAEVMTYTSTPPVTGVFGNYSLAQYSAEGGGNAPTYGMALDFNASKANSIYGNSTTVRPESHDWIICAVAFGTATNVGEVDVANVMSAVSQVQANPNLQGAAHVVETWKSSNGSSWYRKWSDGWIEQGGPMSTNENVTFHVSFSNTNYYIDVTWNGGKSGVFWPADWQITKSSNTYFTTTATTNATNVRGLCWYACGY